MAQNRLAHSASAYLRSAQHQPIDWYEFGEEAFKKAEELDRLILLDIGAVWCHWCHVIDRESYENPEIAQLINDNYIAIKVDRDQRPDIDARYQQIVASMTGQGGWPLTAFLTCDGRVLYGGTYFPPEVMTTLLTQLPLVYQEQKDQIMQESLTKVSQADLDKSLASNEAEARHPIPEDVFERLLNSIDSTYDSENGGFGVYPKFPHYSTLAYLIQQAHRAVDPAKTKELKQVIDRTLTEMARGGVYDHIGGGFHRYSVDRFWHVPHFEKMAYDNAEALLVYAQAYRMSPSPLYLETIEGILNFLSQTLSDPVQGGFYASQDADIDLNDDGDYFTWTMEDVQEALSSHEAEVIVPYYDVTPEGDMHERPGRNVLRIRKNLSEVAKTLGISLEECMERLYAGRQKLAAKRMMRPTPYVDTTIYLNWNGMILVGYFEVADLLGKQEALVYACKTLHRLLNTHVDREKDILLHSEGVPGFLDDYAWMVAALLRANQSTGDERYLSEATHWAQRACELFEDAQFGGFFDIPAPAENAMALLKFRRKPTEDNPSSSANAVMIRNLIRLFHITEDTVYHEKAAKALAMFGRELSGRNGVFVSALAIALFEFRHPPVRLEVLGRQAELHEAALGVFYPGKIVVHRPDDAPAEVRLCEGTRCMMPVRQVADLETAVNALKGIPV